MRAGTGRTRFVTIGGAGNGASGGNSGKSMEELLAEGMARRGYTYENGSFTKGVGQAGQSASHKSMEELLVEGMERRGYTYENGGFTRQKYMSYSDALTSAAKEADSAKARMESSLSRVKSLERQMNNTGGLRFVQLNENGADMPELTQSGQITRMRSAERGLTAEQRSQLGETLKSAYEEYTGAVDTYNNSVDKYEQLSAQSGAAWDRYMRSVRDADTITPELESAKKRMEELERQLASLQAPSAPVAHAMPRDSMGMALYQQRLQEAQAAIPEVQKELEEAQREYDRLQEEMDLSTYLKWEKLRGNQDFGEKSGYVPTGTVETYEIPGYVSDSGIITPGRTGFKKNGVDIYYEYINGNPAAAEAVKSGLAQPAEFMFGEGDYLSTITDDEKALYNYVYATQGKEAAEQYLSDLKTTLTARMRTQSEKDTREYAKEHPWISNIGSVLLAPAKGLSYLGQAGRALTGQEIDQNAAYNRFSYLNSAVRDETSGIIEKKWGKVGSFGYQTGMSMADFLWTTAMSGGWESLALGIMGTNAAADATIEAKDRGLSDGKAFALGTIAGLAEIATEYWSLEKLLDMTSLGKSAAGYLFKNIVAESSEEGASDIINMFADLLISQDKSQWEEQIKELKAQHPDWSDEKAFEEALKLKATEVGLDMLGGAISGGVMAGGSVAFDAAGNYIAGRELTQRYGAMGAAQMAIDSGLEMGRGTDSYERAVRYRSALLGGREPSAGRTGRLVRGALFEEQQRAQTQAGEPGTAATAPEQTRMEPQTPTPAAPQGQTQGQAQVEEGEIPDPPMTTQEREAAVREREEALNVRAEELMSRGDITDEERAELAREYAAIEREKEAIAREETREYNERRRAETTLPTAEELERRREAAGNLRELERSGRESGATEEQIGVARRIAGATGRRIVFINEGRNAKRGQYTSGTIYVNAAYGNETGQIIAHEMTHSIESSGHYEEFSRLVQQRIVEAGGDLDGMLREKREIYASAGINLDSKSGKDMKEVVAEYVERELLSSPESIESLVREHRSWGRKILDLLDDLLAKITKSEAARERAFIRRARDLYAQALQDTRSETDSEAALQQLREALAAGEITEEEFDQAYDALGIGVEERGGGQSSIAASASRQEVAGRLRSMLNSGASVEEIRRYVNSVSDTGTRQSPAGTRTDGARQILRAAHESNMSVDEYLRQNWDEYEVDGQLRPEARRALEMEGGRQYSISSSLRDDLDKVLNGTFNSSNGELIIGTTSDFLTNVIGAEQVTVTMPANKAYNAMVTEARAKQDGRYDPNQHYHGLGVNGLIEALTKSEDPVAAFADTPDNSGNKRIGRIVLVTEMTNDAGSNVIVVDELNAKSLLHGKHINVNKTITVYPRGTVESDIRQAAADGRLLAIDKKRSSSIVSGVKGANSPTAISNAELKNNIQRFWSDVNWKNEGRKYSSTKSDSDGKTEMQRAFERAGGKTQFSIAQDSQEDTDTQEGNRTDIRDTIPAKARGYLERVERGLVNKVGALLQVPRFAQREYLRDISQEMSREYLTEGSVSQETRDKLFEEAYSRGVEVDREFYDQYKDLKKRLREKPITISNADFSDVRGFSNFEEFRKAAFGTLRIVKEGATPVDTAYQELSAAYPDLFPEEITHPGDQIVRMYEVGRSIAISERTLDEVLGPRAEEYKSLMRNDFEAAVGDMIAELRTVKRYTEDRVTSTNAPETTLTLEEIKELYPKARDARKNYEKVSARNLLTAEDQRQVGRLMRGDIELSDLKAERDNVRGITEVFEAKQEYEKYASQIREWNETRKAQLRDEADEYLYTANAWHDKRAGILYSRETMERNIRDIVKDRNLADRIVKKYFTPVHEAAAKSTKLKNTMRDRVRALDLSRKVARGNKVSEAHAVQLLGEAMDNIDYLQKARHMKERDGKSLSDWRGVVQELHETNPNMDWRKVERAIEEFRKIYDELFEMMNDSRVKNGYEPVAYRKGYFPHFQPGEGDGVIALFGKALGISTDVTALPTTINGLTHTFRPGIQWFGNALERTGFDTAYDAVEGFDKYIEGVADVIFQTENIQRLRALSSQIRYRTSDEGLRKQVDEVRADTSLREEDKQNRIEKIYEKGRFTLSNFVVELEEYTNLLANKKSRADRNMEQALGRNMYNLVKTLEGRVAANMVAVNPGSWLTNFIPLTQGGAMLDRGMLLHGMWDTMKATTGKFNDDIVSSSVFLTNRRGSDPLVRTWQQKASATMSKPMEWIDNFTADSLVRARYRQNVQNRHMSEAAAMEEADNWVAGVMADRSKGSTPTLFNRSNPLTKLFTQFQLEVNNQLSYVYKDMPRGLKEKGLGALALALFKFALGAWLYDEVYEYFIGRRPALDPIGMLNDTVGDLTGWELPNMVSLVAGAFTGDMPSFETEKAGVGGAISNLGENVAEELPFVGGLLGGGRLPISSALPDIGNLLNAATNSDWSAKKRWATAVKELANPLTYLVLPFGGGQMKKILQGVGAVVKGGSFTVDSEGRDIMQYPVYNDSGWGTAWNAFQGTLFGKSSFPGAQRWVESGFKNYSAKATGAYQGLVAAGIRGRDADNIVLALSGAEKTEEKSKRQVQIDILRSAAIPEDLKIIPYYALIASDSEISLIDGLAGGDASELLNVLMGMRDADTLSEGSTQEKRNVLFSSTLTDDEIIAVYRSQMSADYALRLQKAQEYGISMRDYYNAAFTPKDRNGDGKITQDEITQAIRSMNLTRDQKAVLWQLATGSSSPGNNPFGSRKGQEIYDWLQEEKEARKKKKEAKNTENEEEKSGPRWENGRLVLPKYGESRVLPRG